MTSITDVSKVEYDQTVLDWLNSQKASTRTAYNCYFKYVAAFTGLNGKEILEDRKSDKEFKWEKLSVEIMQWVKQQGLSDNSSKGVITSLRSFFTFYRCPLVLTKQEKNKVSGRAERKTEDYVLTTDVLTKMFYVADLREKYIIAVGKSIGLRASDFVTFTYGFFRALDLSKEAPVGLGKIQTIKEKVDAYPFLDYDAIAVVKAVLEANTDKPDTERILTFNETELSTVLQKLAVKAHINLGNKHLRFHCMRKFLCDKLAGVMSTEKWKQIVGKVISESAYIGSEDLGELYKQVMSKTALNGNGNGKVSKLAGEVEQLREEVGTYKMAFNGLLDAFKKRGLLDKSFTFEDIVHEQQEQEEKDKQFLAEGS